MEVTSVSPSATSPTEGDNLCEIDVTKVAIHSVTLLISLCGLVGNGAVLWILRLKLRNAGFHLAVLDFLFLLFAIPSTILFLVEDISCSPILPLHYLSFLFPFSLVSLLWALPRLLFTRSVLHMVKLGNLCCHCSLSRRMRWELYGVQMLAIFALYFLILVVIFWCSPQQEVQCRAALLSMYIIVLVLVAPMVISFTINLIKASCGSNQQQPKRRDIVVFIMVLLIPVLSLGNFRGFAGFPFMSSEVVFLLNCIYNSIKPCIYFLAGKCWRPCSVESVRLSLQRVFDEPEENTAHSNDASEDEGV